MPTETSWSRMGIGEAAKEDAIDNAEYCRRRANAQHQRDKNRGRKERVAGEAAKSVADILKDGFDKKAWPLLVRLFFATLDSPKRNDRLPTRLFRRHAGSDVYLGLLFEVELRLIVYLMMRLGS